MENINKQNSHFSIDIITIFMISTIVWVLKAVIHELLGHGVAVILSGGKIISISTMWCHHTEITSLWGNKLVIAAGSLANLIFGFFALLLLRKETIKKPNTIFFLWLFMTINIFHSGSYMIGWFIGPTLDWANFIKALEPLWFWKVIVTTFGIIIVLLGFHLATKHWHQFIGKDKKTQKSRITKITFIPWLTCILMSLSGLILYETDQLYMMIMGAIGTSGWFLIWMLLLRFWPFNKKIVKETKFLPINRSYAWMSMGLISLVFFIFIMGRGISFPN